jgi:transcriptional regulator with PAS, ATPase and Fis domain
MKGMKNSENESILMLLKEIKEILEKMSGESPIEEYEKDKLRSILKEIISPEPFKVKSPLKNLNSAKEKEKIISTLQKYNGNKTKTAYMLGIHYTTLLYKMKKFDIT